MKSPFALGRVGSCQDFRQRLVLRYLGFTALANLVWEAGQLPLYTIWQSASVGQLTYAVVHCTVGDVLIAFVALALARLVAGHDVRPARADLRIAALATGLGLLYTIWSEWVNVDVLTSWAYGPAMPVLPLIRTGVSPMLQWLILPPLGLWWAWSSEARRARHSRPTAKSCSRNDARALEQLGVDRDDHRAD